MEPQEPPTDIQNTEIIQTDFEKTAGTNKLKYVVVPVFCIIFLALLVGTGIFLFSPGSDTQIPEKESYTNSEHESHLSDNKHTAPSIHDRSWMLVLVNEDHPLQDNYKPELQDIGNGEYFDARAADSLLKMLSDAKAEGLSPLVCSAYRDAEFQTELYNSQVEAQMETGLTYTEALEEAKKVVAYPGTSEHQLGLAVDIVASDYQLLDDGQAETEEAKWLMENCHKYGFILRYPPDKTHITGIIFEPWHYRYVGQEAATAIMSENLCLEEYLELYYDWQ